MLDAFPFGSLAENKINFAFCSLPNVSPRLNSVGEVGIEPTLLSEHDLKSCASAYSATRPIPPPGHTPAYGGAQVFAG